jgi:hypothetical protein
VGRHQHDVIKPKKSPSAVGQPGFLRLYLVGMEGSKPHLFAGVEGLKPRLWAFRDQNHVCGRDVCPTVGFASMWRHIGATPGFVT